VPSDLSRHWALDPAIDFLNHGSFGACPRAVLAEQQRLRDELESNPVEFLARRLPERLDAARVRLAAFLGADPESLVFVANATTGVNTVLASLELAPGDEIVTTDHLYNACRNALDATAARRGATVRIAQLPFPGATREGVLDAVLAAVGERTRLVVVDHVTSPTGLVLPVDELVAPLAARGVDLLVDGAHAPGMLPLALDELACAYYTGNCHKWICAPKGAAFLWLREELRDRVRPLVISHGANSRRPGRSRLHDEFDWVGTDDPTPYLCVPTALATLEAMVPGGWPEVRRRNRELALAARRLLAAALDVPAPCGEEMLGSLAALPLPGSPASANPVGESDPLQARLYREHRIETMIYGWPPLGLRLLRVSAQLYNSLEQYERLANVLRETQVLSPGSPPGRG
jgi:isopenicillin-N epimerase